MERKTLFIIGGVLLAIVLVIVAVIMFMGKGRDTPDIQTTDQPNTLNLLTRTLSAPLGPLCPSSAKPIYTAYEVPKPGASFSIVTDDKKTRQKKRFVILTDLLYITEISTYTTSIPND